MVKGQEGGAGCCAGSERATQRKGDHAQSMQTHHRARQARGDRRAAREWVVRALRNGAEVQGRMVKGEGGGAGCCAGSERATMRMAC
jgi:hypothetical protein